MWNIEGYNGRGQRNVVLANQHPQLTQPGRHKTRGYLRGRSYGGDIACYFCRHLPLVSSFSYLSLTAAQAT